MIYFAKDDRQDGMAIDGRFKDSGKVPLFYSTELVTEEPMELPVFFRRKDFVNEWNRLHPGEPLPSVRVIDLLSIFEAILRSRNDAIPSMSINDSGDPIPLRFVPSPDEILVFQELKSRGLAPYNPSRMII
jgi:hypothetical protein